MAMNNNERLHAQPKQKELKPVLGVTDDIPLLRSFVKEFKDHGYGIVQAVNADQIEEANSMHNPQIVLLDTEYKGFKVKDFPEKKVIAILKRGSSMNHRAKVMESGVENYVIRPVQPSHARFAVQSVDDIKSSSFAVDRKGQIEFGKFTLDLDARCGVVNGMNIDFTFKEFEFLKLLVMNGESETVKGSVKKLFNPTSLRQLESSEGIIIHKIRKKLIESKAPLEIETIRGIGWKLNIVEDEK